jgi:uncharacterized protein with HEPN domain
MYKRDVLLLLEDMLESAKKVRKYTHGLDFDSFMNEEKTLDAVIRNFEIIGEAANRIDSDFRKKNPGLEWKRIRGFRNRIVHDYFGIDYEIVWSIIDNDLDQLIIQLERLVQNFEKDNSNEA